MSKVKFLNDFDFNSCGFIIGIEARKKAKIYRWTTQSKGSRELGFHSKPNEIN